MHHELLMPILGVACSSYQGDLKPIAPFPYVITLTSDERAVIHLANKVVKLQYNIYPSSLKERKIIGLFSGQAHCCHYPRQNTYLYPCLSGLDIEKK